MTWQPTNIPSADPLGKSMFFCYTEPRRRPNIAPFPGRICPDMHTRVDATSPSKRVRNHGYSEAPSGN